MQQDDTDGVLMWVTGVTSVVALWCALALILTGCFAIRAIEGDPEKRKPDLTLPELSLSTNLLSTNAPAIQ